VEGVARSAGRETPPGGGGGAKRRKGIPLLANPIVHFEILGPDAGTLHSFYRDMFGWEIDADNEWNYGMVAAPDSKGIPGGVGAGMDGGSKVVVYAEVPDLQAALDKAVSLGGNVVMEPADLGMVQLAQFTDPAGNLFGLVKG
jgi:predicted enzyme related to lactoylglutathione lyase